MTKKQSAVLYIDILGFSALTRGLVGNITDSDYQAYNLTEVEDKNYVALAAKILSEFRSVLGDTRKKYPSIQICQMSDCAFVWTDDVKVFLPAVHYIMWNMIQNKGILCRGGISYGEIIEVDTIYAFGKTIVGDAATNAAKNESRLKGPRISMDADFPDAIWSAFRDDLFILCTANDLFHAITSEVDLSEENEYRWFLFDDDYLIKTLGKSISFGDCVELTKQRLKLSNMIKFHPRMGWNTRSADGINHLRAGLLSLSKNELLRVLHSMESSVIPDNDRTLARYEKANDRIDKNRYFSISQREDFDKYIRDVE